MNKKKGREPFLDQGSERTSLWRKHLPWNLQYAKTELPYKGDIIFEGPVVGSLSFYILPDRPFTLTYPLTRPFPSVCLQ